MDCVNHPGVTASVYCQNCGKPLCAACVRREAAGQVLCEPCRAMRQPAQTPYGAGFVPPPPGAPHPTAAAWLGLIPGVGAMYNGQFLKGFLHVIVFAVLVSMSHAVDVLGFLVMAWIFYQVFDAYQTAKAKRDGQPLPDPLGMNELANWVNHEFRRNQGMPPPPAAGYAPPAAGAGQGQAQWQGGYQAPPYTPPDRGYAPPPPAAGYAPPPMPPVPPAHWRREPVAAIVLIAMGLLFLMGQVSGRILEFTWPVVLIVLGAWLFVRRVQDTRRMMPPPAAGAPPAAPETPAGEPKPAAPEDEAQGGLK